MNESVTYQYSDGSGNTYVISGGAEKTIEYRPVKPEMSSSGVYDGGDPVKKELSASQYDDLLQSIQAAINNKDNHIEAREMMSGMIRMDRAGQQMSYFLLPSALEKRELEKKLRLLLQ